MIIENDEQRRRRIMGKQFMSRYLNSLSTLLTYKISSESLLSIIETDSFYSQIDYQKKAHIRKKILFSERIYSEQILKAHSIDFNEQYILWIEYANDCGALKLESLNHFSFNFPYDVSNNGIITLTQINYQYQILLDFYEENSIEYLDVEIFYNIKR